MTVEKQFERFMREKQFLLDRSPKTLTYLRTRAKLFLPIIAPAKNEGELRGLVAEAVDRILARNIRGCSKNTYLSPLRTFLNWLVAEEVISKAVRIKKVKIEKKLRAILTAEEVRTLLSYKAKHRYQRRMQAAVALMLDTGLRSSEWRNAKRKDFDFDGLHLKVYGKGSVERLVPFSEECRKFLMRWLIRDVPQHFEFVFCTKGDKPISDRNALHDIVRLGAWCKIWKINLHMLRHTFATSWVRSGGNVEILRRILGHKDIRTTMIYMSNSVEDVKVAHSKFSAVALYGKHLN
jgi:integrase/recombinase XerD